MEENIDCHVYTVDENGFVYNKPIAQWHPHGEQEIMEYTLEDGRTIRAIKDHKMMTETGKMVAIDEIFQKGLD